MRTQRRAVTRLRVVGAAATVLTLLLAGCTGGDDSHHASDSSQAPHPAPPTPQAAVVRTAAKAVGSDQVVTIAATPITAAEKIGLAGAAGKTGTLFVGQPVEITTPAPFPAGGITLTRRYSVAVPAGMDASFAYWDTTLAGWHAVPSSLSADRRTVTALVRHLSTWTDFVGSATSAVGNAVGSARDAVVDFGAQAADWGYYEVGKVFDTRVDAPTCSSTPSWVSSANFIETARNNSLLFCAGHDPKHSDVLVVKARVNRGFAFTATLGADTTWQYNSTSTHSLITDARTALGHLDDTLARALDDLAPPGQVLVGAGKEFDAGFSADAVRNAGTSPVVLSFAPPTVARFLMSVVGALSGDILSDAQSGYVSGAILLAGCLGDLHDVTDVGTFVRAAKTCLSGLDSAAGGVLANYLRVKKGLSPGEAGKVAGKLVARVGVYLALVGPVFSGMNFVAEQTLPASSRTVTIIPKAKPVAAGNGRWTGPTLLITGSSLGAVTSSMTPEQASAAAGTPITGCGDGSYCSKITGLTTATGRGLCLGAYLVTDRSLPAGPRVLTRSGFTVGQSLTRLKEIYGARLHYSAGRRTTGRGYYDAGTVLDSGWWVADNGGWLRFNTSNDRSDKASRGVIVSMTAVPAQPPAPSCGPPN